MDASAAAAATKGKVSFSKSGSFDLFLAHFLENGKTLRRAFHLYCRDSIPLRGHATYFVTRGAAGYVTTQVLTTLNIFLRPSASSNSFRIT